MTILKQRADSYAAAIQDASDATRPKIIEMVGEGVNRLPNGSVGGSVESKLILLRGEFVFAERELKQFARDLFLDRFNRVSADAHGSSPSVVSDINTVAGTSSAPVPPLGADDTLGGAR